MISFNSCGRPAIFRATRTPCVRTHAWAVIHLAAQSYRLAVLVKQRRANTHARASMLRRWPTDHDRATGGKHMHRCSASSSIAGRTSRAPRPGSPLEIYISTCICRVSRRSSSRSPCSTCTQMYCNRITNTVLNNFNSRPDRRPTIGIFSFMLEFYMHHATVYVIN